MLKFCFFSLLLLFSCVCTYGQLTARASTTATIINPVGTQNSATIISARLPQDISTGIVAMKSNAIGIENNTPLTGSLEEAGSSSFHVVSNEFVYAITLSYDPIISNQQSTGGTMEIESLSVLPAIKKDTENKSADDFFIGGKFNLSAKQAPGNYSSSNPATITIHFN